MPLYDQPASVPLSQSFALANDAYQTLQQWTVTGQTDDPLPAFALVATSRTYGTSPAIQGPVAYMGYNVLPTIGGPSNSHGSATISWFADAGDTNNGAGGHGIELNLSFSTAGVTAVTPAFQMVAVDDTTNTVNIKITCGSGTSDGYTSNITFQTAVGGAGTFCVMSNANSNITFYRPVVFEEPLTFIDSGGITWPLTLTDPTADSSVGFASANTGTTAVITLNGTSTSTSSEIFFAEGGTQKWAIEHTPPYLYIRDVASARSALYMYPGTTPANSKMYVNSVLQSTNSIVTGAAALATTATDGFLYLPSCPGVPTGTPTTWAGTVPCVFDSTDGKIYFYTGGAWVGLND